MMTTRWTKLLAALSAATILSLAENAMAADPVCTVQNYAGDSLSGSPSATAELPAGAQRILRFVQLSDVHIYDDDGSPVFNGSELEPALEPTIGNGSAQRLQDEYTDEVLNAMEKTVNFCHAQDPIELMIATGDNTDTMTLNEVRRYIDNLDGVRAGDTAYEANCGYTTVDSNGRPKGGLPDHESACPPEVRDAFQVPTGKVVADSQSRPPQADDPADQFMPLRSPRQNVDTAAQSALGLSLNIAPGLPPILRCDHSDPSCDNEQLSIPYYAVFGNHDGAIRGTLTMNRAFQAGPAPFGRYFLQSQREWINEFFYTATTPDGHGFDRVDPARWNDADDRNDGYYAFDTAGGVRVIVLNTLYDGVRSEFHRSGQTGSDTQGLVAGNEVTNPIGLEQGVMPAEQFVWLESELAAAARDDKPALAFSHHPDRSFTDRRLGFAADGGKTAKEVDELFGRTSFTTTSGTHPSTFVAHIAGHTHENIIRKCQPGTHQVTKTDGTTATVSNCPIGSGEGATEPLVGRAFWRIETASLIDYPQEGRIIEVFNLEGGGHALRLTMLRPDPEDATANYSRKLAEAEATCNVSAILGGPPSSGPYDDERLTDSLGRAQQIVEPDGEGGVRAKFCFGQASLVAAEGPATSRDVILLP